jgi:hypothetical protein
MDTSISCPKCTVDYLKINGTSLHEYTCQHCGHIWPKSMVDVKNELSLLKGTYHALDVAHQTASKQIQDLRIEVNNLRSALSIWADADTNNPLMQTSILKRSQINDVKDRINELLIKQRRACALWIEDSRVNDCPLITDED